MLTPVSWWSNKTTFTASFSSGEFGGTGIKCFPIGKTWAHFLHVTRIPPVFTGNSIVCTKIKCSCCNGFVKAFSLRTFPNFNLEIHVA